MKRKKTHLNAAQNMPMPKIVIAVPGKSSLFNVSSLKLTFEATSFGTVKTAIIETSTYTIASKKKLALQLKICVASPLKMVPKTKPKGLPAEKQAKTLFFLCPGC